MKKVVIILVALIILMALCFVGLTIYNNNNKKEETNTPITSTNQLQDVDIDSSIVSTTLKQAQKIKKNYTNKKLSKDELIATALINLNEASFNVCVAPQDYTKTIELTDINKTLSELMVGYEEITINDIKNQDTNIIYSLTNGMHQFVLQDDKIYPVTNCDGVYGPKKEFVSEKAIKSTKDDEHLYIYTKVAFAKLTDRTDEIEYAFYTDANYTSQVVENIIMPSSDEMKNPTWDKYNTYKYTFKLVKNKYLFESIELDK